MRGGYDYASAAILHPHRLRRAGYPENLPLDQLILPMSSSQEDLLGIVSAQLLPYLNPRTVIHKDLDDRERAFEFWGMRVVQFDVAFLRDWRRLRRVIWEGSFLIADLDEANFPRIRLYERWSPSPPADGASAMTPALEMVFDFASRFSQYESGLGSRSHGPISLERVLERGGFTQRWAERVKAKATLVVKQADETIVRSDVKELEGWLKKLIVVEVV